MKAVVYTHYGPPDALQLKEVEKPVPENGEVLIRIHATTVNRTDCATIRAIPFFARIITGLFEPKKQIPELNLRKKSGDSIPIKDEPAVSLFALSF